MITTFVMRLDLTERPKFEFPVDFFAFHIDSETDSILHALVRI